MTVFFVLRRDKVSHKLRYSKTLKGDSMGAFLGLVIGLFIGYLSLASVGACSVDFQDLTTLLYYASMIGLSLNSLLNSFSRLGNFLVYKRLLSF